MLSPLWQAGLFGAALALVALVVTFGVLRLTLGLAMKPIHHALALLPTVVVVLFALQHYGVASSTGELQMMMWTCVSFSIVGWFTCVLCGWYPRVSSAQEEKNT